MNAHAPQLPTDPKATADLVLGDALALLRRLGVPLDVQIDRMTVFAAGAHVSLVGGEIAAQCFRAYADRIEEGLFDRKEPRH